MANEIITLTAEVEKVGDQYYAVNRMGPFPVGPWTEEMVQKVSDKNRELVVDWTIKCGHPPKYIRKQ
jgi:hypothetical protein